MPEDNFTDKLAREILGGSGQKDLPPTPGREPSIDALALQVMKRGRRQGEVDKAEALALVFGGSNEFREVQELQTRLPAIGVAAEAIATLERYWKNDPEVMGQVLVWRQGLIRGAAELRQASQKIGDTRGFLQTLQNRDFGAAAETAAVSAFERFRQMADAIAKAAAGELARLRALE
ncbi:MAG: hypothetical protein Q7K39_02220 [Candidatus Magasanikbacteria bacterium]|nr:hypothetical protein [Candidatus Magasanikbacteria bacterium]